MMLGTHNVFSVKTAHADSTLQYSDVKPTGNTCTYHTVLIIDATTLCAPRK